MNERSEGSEERVRRVLQEVAGSNRAAHGPPPALGEATVTVVAIGGARRRRWDRAVLGAVAAAVVLVAGALVVVASVDDEQPDDRVAVADDDATTTTDDVEPPSSTSTPPPSSVTTATSPTTTAESAPTSTVPAPAPVTGEVLAVGDGWQVLLSDDCVHVLVEDMDLGHECDRDRDVWLLAAPLAEGRTVHVAGGRRVGFADLYHSGGLWLGEPELATDSGTGRYLVTESLPDVVILREGPNADWVAGIYGGVLRTEPATFAAFSGYERATGSLSFGRYQEIGGYDGGGGRCVVARQLTPEPMVIADLCLEGDISAVLVPTQDTTLFDVFGIVMDVGDWRCELPGGGSCGQSEIAGIAGFAGIIANRGPIAVGDADEVVLRTDRTTVVVPVPRGTGS